MAYLACADLSVGYAGNPIVEGISFTVSPGDAVFAVGENGTGKSTLMKTLLGLLPPIAGTIRFDDGAGAGSMGYLPQRNESQRDFPASVWEIVLSGRVSRLGARPFFSRTDRAIAQNALERVGALPLRDKPFGVLSGGQQQRVLLARALAGKPKMLVLDEPTTGLDPDAAEALYREIDGLRAAGTGVLAVTHDISGVAGHATHVLTFADGRAHIAPVGVWMTQQGVM